MGLTELLDFLRRKMEEEMAGWGQTVDTFKTSTHLIAKHFMLQQYRTIPAQHGPQSTTSVDISMIPLSYYKGKLPENWDLGSALCTIDSVLLLVNY